MNKSSTRVFWLLIGLSTALHAMLFVAWFNFSNNTPVTFQQDKATISIQIVENNNVVTPSISKKSINIQNKIPKKNKTSKVLKEKKNTDKTPTQELNTQSIQTLVKSEEKKSLNKLYKLLYSAIDSHKMYPTSALRMQRQGTVQVAFNLLNSGELNNIEISNSSGYNALDKAALLAVKKIQPFHPAALYVSDSMDFKLNIIFQL